PGAVANAITLPADTFTGDGKPATPYTRTYALTGDMVSGTATAGTYVGMAAFRDQMVDSAAANAPLPTKGYTRTNEIVTRYDFTTYQTFTIDVAVDANQPPVADLVANPLSVPNGGTTQLSPGPGTADPDGSITLYEYDFNYDGTFTADTSNTTGAAVTSPALTTAGTVTMALRVTDNGTPGKAAIDTADVTVQAPPNQPPTAEAVANPTTVPNGGTTQLSPGPGTADPDGSITLYEYDFNYSGTFTADASNTTGAAVTSPALTTAGSVTMALRVTDNGTPGLTALDTVDVVVEAPPANQPPTADVVANPTTVASGATTQLSPGPGTGDPDGSVILYEFDFEYTGTFTADTSNTTGAAVTSPALTNAGAAPITRQMAMRVTDNGAPGLTAIDTVTVTINPAPSGPTWTQIHNLIVNGDPAVEFSDCVACHAGGQGGLTMNANKDTTYANLVNVASSCGTDYVEPNNAAASLLYHKLTPSPGCGARMPRGGPYWTAASIQMVADWINAGAPNN
ncbi:MAG TPA: hypothetical protein VEI97_19815, partial [bacterium]|nr:hypothetical protein [bacterium]